MEVKLKEMVEKTKGKLAGESLFGSTYKGGVDNFLNFVQESLSMTSTPDKYMVGIVQATLSGKTRLIIEASLRHPIVLISFKKGNIAYWQTLEPSISYKNKKSQNYKEQQIHNQIILLKVRLFILSHLEFASLYKKEILGNKPWKECEVIEKQVLSALLLNGGNALVNEMLEKHLEDINEDYLVSDESYFEETKLKVKKQLHQQLKDLGDGERSCWIAYDECHVPQHHCQGLLFHSDYIQRLEKATVSGMIYASTSIH
jgi:hypothetical protein